MPEQSKAEFEIRSPEVQEILGHPPHWLLRSGITVILLIILLFLLASWIIKYPDIITARVEITAINPPHKLIARNDGKLDVLYCADRQIVDSGQVLAIIKNPASTDEVSRLKVWLTKINPWMEFHDSLHNKMDSLRTSVPSLSALGEVQSFFELFVKSVEDYSSFISIHAADRKIISLLKQQNDQQDYIKNCNVQNSIVQKQFKLCLSQFKRDSLLFKEGAVPESEYEKSKGSLLDLRYRNSSGKMAEINARIQLRQIEQEIIDLQIEQQKAEESLKNQVNSTYSNLINSIGSWEYHYVFTASQKGRISFNQIWSVNQSIKSGETLLTIIPLHPLEIKAKAQISMSGSGKIRPGQRVNIKLTNYPYQEFGMIEGRLEALSEAPLGSMFTAEISLPGGLLTNYKKQIPFSQGLEGQADIITEDLSLLLRFFNPLKALFYEKVKR